MENQANMERERMQATAQNNALAAEQFRAMMFRAQNGQGSVFNPAYQAGGLGGGAQPSATTSQDTGGNPIQRTHNNPFFSPRDRL